MRKPTLYIALFIVVGSLATALAFFANAQPAAGPDVCDVEKATPPPVESLGSGLLWESLSRQFVSSVHY